MAVHSTHTAVAQSLLEGANNTRDLGGHRTSDGRTVRHGLIFRSDALVDLTAADRNLLRSLELHTIVDLRTHDEITWHGPNQCEPGTRVIREPLIDDGGDALALTLSRAFNEQNAATITALLGGGRVHHLVDGIPSRFLDGEPTRAGFAQVLQLLADGHSPLMFVCRSGKDRTGFMAAVILRTLGVTEADVVADYVLSNAYLAATNQEMVSILISVGVDPEIVRPLIEQQAEVMESFFAEVTARFDDWDGYLTHGLELDAEIPQRLRQRYLEPATG